MPYIQRSKRYHLDKPLQQLVDTKEIICSGDLNYCFTKLCLEFIKEHGESYSNYAECISALECAKLELYRRQIAPYEVTKITENGDIE